MGLVARGAALVPFGRARADDGGRSSPPVEPFQAELPMPAVHQSVSQFSVGPAQPQCTFDADLYSHAGLLTFGNESTGRWSALPGTMDAREITRTIPRRTRTKPQRP